MQSLPHHRPFCNTTLGKGGRSITCTLDGLMHIAHDGPTGQGKTSLIYSEIAQLLVAGIRVLLLNPHFMPVDRKNRDWRPVGRAILAQGLLPLAPNIRAAGLIIDVAKIVLVLRWLSVAEIDRRIRMMRAQDFSFTPLFLFLDEWPLIASRAPDAALYLRDILQRGRAVEVYVSTSAQGFLVSDVDLKGSARENFATVFHLGGSPRSGSVLLDMPAKDITAILQKEQVTLGKGIAFLRNNEACPQAELVRLPYCTNEDAYYLLGRADNWTLPGTRVEMVENEAEMDGSEAEGLETGAPCETEPLNEELCEYDTSAQAEEEESLEDRVLRAWREEGHTGVRKIERAFGISYHQARKICAQLGLTGD